MEENRQVGARLRLAKKGYLRYMGACRKWHRARKAGDLGKIETLGIERDRLARKTSREYHEASMMLKRIAYHGTSQD